MAAKRVNPMAGEDDQDENGLAAPYRPTRRRMVRVLVPVGVAGVAAASIGLVPALASDDGPKLPELSAQQLVAKVLASDVQSLSGTVQSTADLGIPEGVLGGLGGAAQSGGGAFGGHRGGGSGAQDGAGQDGSTAAPEAQLTQLLSGTHTLQVAVDGPDRQRLGLMDKLAEYEIVHNGGQAWAWDSRTNEAVHLTLPAGHGRGAADGAQPFGGGKVPGTPQEAARQFLAMSGSTTSVSVAGTTRVAGHNAYELSVKPRQEGSTVGDVRIAVDAESGVPLRVRVNAAGGGDPVFDMHFTSVTFGKPGARTFDFTPPKGAKVTEDKATAGDLAAGGQAGARKHAVRPKADGPKADGPAVDGLRGDGFRADGLRGDAAKADGPNVIGEGWTSVASFKLPDGMAGGDQGVLSLVKGFGKRVTGGTLIHSRLVNVLIGDNGNVYAGAVSAQVLEHAAGAR